MPPQLRTCPQSQASKPLGWEPQAGRGLRLPAPSMCCSRAGHSGAGPGFSGEGVPQPALHRTLAVCSEVRPSTHRPPGLSDAVPGTHSLHGPDLAPSVTSGRQGQACPGGPPGQQGWEPWGGRSGGSTWHLQEDKDSSGRGAGPGDAARGGTRQGLGARGAVFPSCVQRLRQRASLTLQLPRRHRGGPTPGGRPCLSAGCWDLCVTPHRSRPSTAPGEADTPSVRGTSSP